LRGYFLKIYSCLKLAGILKEKDGFPRKKVENVRGRDFWIIPNSWFEQGQHALS